MITEYQLLQVGFTIFSCDPVAMGLAHLKLIFFLKKKSCSEAEKKKQHLMAVPFGCCIFGGKASTAL